MRLDQALILSGVVQHYDWGKSARTSLVARLSNYRGDQHTPCAELWIGEHQRGCAQVKVDGQSYSLATLLQQSPELILGQAVRERFGVHLPFMLKVLSIERPLSIQAHPDGATALQLHTQRPNSYPDKGHKPEIAIALTPVTFLYGFKSSSRCNELVRAMPELEDVLPSAILADKNRSESELMRSVYTALLHSDCSACLGVVHKLRRRLSQSVVQRSDEEELFLTLLANFGSEDIGILPSLCLNFCRLNPGQAVFIGPNTPHSYLSGDLVECMASSDTVVRAGLTKKESDLEAFLQIVDYNPSLPVTISAEPLEGEPNTSRYRAPAREFVVDILRAEEAHHTYVPDGRMMLFLCVEGDANIRTKDSNTHLSPGMAALLPACHTGYEITLNHSELYRVSVPS